MASRSPRATTCPVERGDLSRVRTKSRELKLIVSDWLAWVTCPPPLREVCALISQPCVTCPPPAQGGASSVGHAGLVVGESCFSDGKNGKGIWNRHKVVGNQPPLPRPPGKGTCFRVSQIILADNLFRLKEVNVNHLVINMPSVTFKVRLFPACDFI